MSFSLLEESVACLSLSGEEGREGVHLGINLAALILRLKFQVGLKNHDYLFFSLSCYGQICNKVFHSASKLGGKSALC